MDTVSCSGTTPSMIYKSGEQNRSILLKKRERWIDMSLEDYLISFLLDSDSMVNEAKTETRIEERPNNISTDVMLIQFYFEQKSKTEWSLLFNDESICPSVVKLVVVVSFLSLSFF